MKKRKQTSPPEEHLVLLYQKVARLLYGYVAFYRKEHLNQETPNKPYRESSPFVIGKYSVDRDGQLEVLGSVVFLLEEIRRSIRDFIVDNNAWNAERSRLSSEIEIAGCDEGYDKKTMDFVILVSAHGRNLFDLMPRFNERSIPRLDYHGSPDGEITLRELFDTLIHNRYYYFDGASVRDLFSDNFRKKRSALSGRFMGYGFDILEFVKGISEVIEEIEIKDLTRLLRGRFKNLTADSKPQDVVSLIQNVHAFSDLLLEKVSTAGYQFMTSLMFDHVADSVEGTRSMTIPGDTIMETQQVIFTAPRIGIARELNRKEFEIRVRCSVGQADQDVGRKNLKDHTVNVGFEEFFKKVDDAFGNDRILAGRSQRFVSAAADGD